MNANEAQAIKSTGKTLWFPKGVFGLTQAQKDFLPGNMSTISTSKSTGKTLWFPKGVFGEWHEFKSVSEALEAAGAGMHVISVTP